MDQVTNMQSPQNVAVDASLILEQYRQRLVDLLREGEANAWDTGDLLNQIERSGVVRSAGYAKTRTWVDAKVPEAKDKTSTLYRYAKVAAQYSKEQVRKWQVSRLEYLMIHDQEVLGHLVPGDPGQREIELVQEDGSKVLKNFCECTSNDLRFSNQRRKQAKESKPAVVADAADSEAPPSHSASQALVLLGLGIVIAPLAEVLPSPVGMWAAVVGSLLFFAGLAILLHHARATWKKFLVAVKEGRGIAFIKETVANARHGAHKLAAGIRPGIKTNPTPDSLGQSPPSGTKKAA